LKSHFQLATSVQTSGEDVVPAREIKKDGKVLTLRDAQGILGILSAFHSILTLQDPGPRFHANLWRARNG
jgi:hypothetical protein